MFCHSWLLYSEKESPKMWRKKCFLQRGPSCFVAAGSQIGKMQYKVWPLRLLHCSGLVWVFSGEIPTHFSTFGRKQPRTAVLANYPFKYLHISLSGVFSITCGSLWRKALLEETAEEIFTLLPNPSPWPPKVDMLVSRWFLIWHVQVSHFF